MDTDSPVQKSPTQTSSKRYSTPTMPSFFSDMASDPATLEGQQISAILVMKWRPYSSSPPVGDFVKAVCHTPDGWWTDVKNLKSGDTLRIQWKAFFPMPYLAKCGCKPEACRCIRESYEEYLRRQPTRSKVSFLADQKKCIDNGKFDDFEDRKDLLTFKLLNLLTYPRVMFGHFGKRKSSLVASVLFPLYIHPLSGAWDPLYTAIEGYPKVNFTLVINPNSGPGPESMPDANFTKGILKLNKYPNVINVGYVSTNYSSRDISLVLQDIHTYSGWALNTTVKGLGMHGIFLDEGASDYNPTSVQYYETLAGAIRSEEGFGKNPVIIQNPGTVPDPRYLSSSTMSVVYEGSFDIYIQEAMAKNISAFRSQYNVKREKLGVIVHSMPTKVTATKERQLVRDLRDLVGNVFLTGLNIDYYEHFWTGWRTFVREMAAN
ncbi:hypothetical protein G7Y89_g5584 [Cudoniella acicularis]|uniref:Uncharacterized protein n=1 Tax=Cudoniella acicularis TaxID=354080 RepID=A0A8H4RM70_9HELO|nr:hypothetical protein G7Y89_g5584 [Cudoniella acicularis]